MRSTRYRTDIVSRAVEARDVVWMGGNSVIVESYNHCYWRRGGKDPEKDGGNHGCRPIGCHAILELSALNGSSVRRKLLTKGE